MKSIFADGELSASISSAMRGWLFDHAGSVQSTSRQASVSPPRSGFSSRVAERHASRAGSRLASQRDACRVARQAVEVGAVAARERLEPVERTGRVERLGVQLQRC